jgi:hypothetical protein
LLAGVWAFFVTDFPATGIFAAGRLAAVFFTDLLVAVLAAARLAVFAFPGIVFGADLDDFSRVFLGIRLPFVAFGGVFKESRDTYSDHQSQLRRLGKSGGPKVCWNANLLNLRLSQPQHE